MEEMVDRIEELLRKAKMTENDHIFVSGSWSLDKKSLINILTSLFSMETNKESKHLTDRLWYGSGEIKVSFAKSEGPFHTFHGKVGKVPLAGVLFATPDFSLISVVLKTPKGYRVYSFKEREHLPYEREDYLELSVNNGNVQGFKDPKLRTRITKIARFLGAEELMANSVVYAREDYEDEEEPKKGWFLSHIKLRKGVVPNEHHIFLVKSLIEILERMRKSEDYGDLLEELEKKIQYKD